MRVARSLRSLAAWASPLELLDTLSRTSHAARIEFGPGHRLVTAAMTSSSVRLRRTACRSAAERRLSAGSDWRSLVARSLSSTKNALSRAGDIVERTRSHSRISRRSRGLARCERCSRRCSASRINPGSLLILTAIARANLRARASCSACDTAVRLTAPAVADRKRPRGGTPSSKVGLSSAFPWLRESASVRFE